MGTNKKKDFPPEAFSITGVINNARNIRETREMLASLTDAQVFKLRSMVALPADEVAGALALNRQLVDAIRDYPSALSQEAFWRELQGSRGVTQMGDCP